ncbi:MAG: metal ABC transporter ATP-binding protein [Alphaproteobacteria bacterium]
MLLLKNISHSYGDTCVLQDISIEFQDKTLTAIVGHNGAGKSTLFKIITKVITPLKGEVIYKSTSSVGYLSQEPLTNRFFPFSVFDVVSMGLWKRIGAFKKITIKDQEKVEKALLDTGLSGFEDRTLSSLSGGQFQRMLFARLIVQEADIIILDEPFTAIDDETTHHLLRIIHNWYEKGKIVLVVEHDLKIVYEFFPKTLILENKILDYGDTKTILANLKKM